MAANFTFPTLTTAVAGYGSTHYTLQADTPSDAFFTTTIAVSYTHLTLPTKA